MVNSLEIVNLSSYELSVNEIMVLKKGLSYCPDQSLDVFSCVKEVNLFSRKLLLKTLLDKKQKYKPNYAELFKGYTVAVFRALKDLILLMQENQEFEQPQSFNIGTRSS